MVEHVQEETLRWGQRGMAALAAVYVAMLFGMLRPGDGYAVFAGYGLAVALPLLVRDRDRFLVACGLMAALVLVAGVLGAMAGAFVFWPAALPLVLALFPVPDRIAPLVLPVVTAALAYLAHLWTLLFR